MATWLSARAIAWILVLPRVFLGVSFLGSDHGSGAPGEFSGFLQGAAARGYPWYSAFLRAVVAPHAELFSTLVLVAELYVGVALVLGLTTRLAAVVALFLLANYAFAKGALPWIPGIDQSDIVLALIILIGSAGRILGLDRYLHQRFPRVPIW